MKWWKKALITSGVWVALTIGAGIVHTNVILAGKLTPDQDDRISGAYGMLCGGGLVAAWLLFYQRRKRNATAP